MSPTIPRTPIAEAIAADTFARAYGKPPSGVTHTSFFCGIGGDATAFINLGFLVLFALNHWYIAEQTINANHPDVGTELCDLSEVDPSRYPTTMTAWFSPECFPAGTLILAKRGLIPIEEIQIGDEVLTHQNRWRVVTQTMNRQASTIILKGQGHPGLEVTAEHPFYVRQQTRKWDNEKRDYDRHVYLDPEWKTAQSLTENTYRWATPVNVEALPIPHVYGRKMPLDDPEFWWLVGRWLGDGTLRLRSDQGGEITIVAGNHEADELEKRLAHWLPDYGHRSGEGELRWRRRQIRTATLFECGHTGLALWLVEHFGRLAHGKTIPAWALSMPESWRQALLEGYISADGHIGIRVTSATTVSKRLAIGIRLIAESLGYRVNLGRYVQHSLEIEGRTLTTRETWQPRWENNASKRTAFDDGQHAWSLIKTIDQGHEDVTVYNLSVEQDESYVADGIVVHNCTAHTLAKGVIRKNQKQSTLWDAAESDPLEERSRMTMYDVVRFSAYHSQRGGYKVVIVENVVDAKLYWSHWGDWLQQMHSLGYEHEIVYLNSMFCGTPQSRDRLYTVFWQKGHPKPDLNFRPRAFCTECAEWVNAVQSWKNPQKQHGKYNSQYVYCCPRCAKRVHPPVNAAASIIDWSKLGTRIGDREKPLRDTTMDRIRKGLNKYKDAFLVELNKSSDRYRVPAVDPLQTILTDNSQAVVSPYIVDTTKTDMRFADVQEPLATLTCTNGLGVVSPFLVSTSHSDERVASVGEPLPTQTARQDMALAFILNNGYGSGDRTSGIDEQLPTLTSRNHPTVIMPTVYTRNVHSQVDSVGRPLTTITAGGNHHFLLTPVLHSMYSGYEYVDPVDKPITTITTIDHHALLTPSWLVPYYGTADAMQSTERPIGTLPTHERYGLVKSIDPADLTPENCYFRMLGPQELKRGQGFPPDYQLIGTNKDQVKGIGNAVSVEAAMAIGQRVLATFA